MRDEKRIRRILEKIEGIWLLHPDQRLSQVLYTVRYLELNQDSYYIEDTTLERLLDAYMKKERL